MLNGILLNRWNSAFVPAQFRQDEIKFAGIQLGLNTLNDNGIALLAFNNLLNRSHPTSYWLL